MKVLFLAAEAVPLAKVGGLGDVAGSLPGALRGLGIEVRVVLPYTGSIRKGGFPVEKTGDFAFDGRVTRETVEVFESRTPAGDFTLVSGTPIRRDHPVYGGEPGEEKRRFAFYSRSALEYCRNAGWKPDVLHAHDFHAAPAVAGLASRRTRNGFFEGTGSLLTIHNLAYMGNGSHDALAEFGIGPADPGGLLPDWAKDSMLGVGIASADFVNTVSPTYSREIRTAEFGRGLEGVLSSLGDRLSGIVNGLDLAAWDPASDAALAQPYAASNLGARTKNRTALQEELGFKLEAGRLLLGIVSRFDEQKGLDISVPALARHAQAGGACAILGSGDERLEHDLRSLEAAFAPRIRLATGFDDSLARRIYAGADALLIPSRYEPCGLTQMIAMRYGALPIARKTGGLADTIRDADDALGNGFLFETLSPEALSAAIDRATAVYARPKRWQELQYRAMREDFSWTRSAGEYADLYRKASDAGHARESE
jgi:starch synthase